MSVDMGIYPFFLHGVATSDAKMKESEVVVDKLLGQLHLNETKKDGVIVAQDKQRCPARGEVDGGSKAIIWEGFQREFADLRDAHGSASMDSTGLVDGLGLSMSFFIFNLFP